MPGLLDFSNADDGMQGLGLLGAAAPSMAPMNFAGRIAQAAQGYQGMKTDALKRDMLQQQMQMEQIKTLMAQKQLGMQLDAYYGDGSGSPGGMSAPQQGGMPSGGSVPMSGGSKPMAGSDASGGGYDINRLQKFALANVPGAKELLDIYKYEHEPQTYAPGSVNQDRITGKITTIPSVSANGQSSQLIPDASVPGGFRVVAPEGAVDTFAAYTQAGKDSDLVDVPDGKGGTMKVYGRQARQMLPGGMPSQATATDSAPSTGAQFVMGKDGVAVDPQEIMKRIAQIPDPQQRMASTKIMQDLIAQQKQAPQVVAGGSLAAVGGTPGYTPPAAQLEADKADALAGVQLKTAPGIKTATEIAGGDAKNFTDYKNTLNKSVETGYQQYMRNQQIEQLMESYKTGLPNPEARSAFASTLKNTFPNNASVNALAEKINGGDIGNGQVLANLLSSAGLTNVIRTLDGNGRINKAEFQALSEHAEKNRSDPDALLGIMRYQNNVFKQDYAEQQALADAERKGGANPKTWQADYLKTRMDNLAQPNALPATPAQVKGALPASPAKPQNMPMKGQVVQGFKFKGGNPADKNNWEQQ